MENLYKNIKSGLFYFAITTVVVVCVASAYIMICLGPDAYFNVSVLWQIILVSLLTSQSHLFFYNKNNRELSGGQFAIRFLIVYVYVNVVVLGLGYLFRWFDPESISTVLGMVVTILVATIVVMFIAFCYDSKTADEINKKLRERNNE